MLFIYLSIYLSISTCLHVYVSFICLFFGSMFFFFLYTLVAYCYFYYFFFLISFFSLLEVDAYLPMYCYVQINLQYL